MRIPFIAGNWKMFKTKADAVKFAEEFKSLYKGTDIQAAICAPFTDLEALAEIFKGTDIKIGAQNVHFADEGAYTGEISVSMLEDSSIRPIMCVGESLEERDAGKAFDRVRSQLEQGLADIDAEAAVRIVIAYEPIWAIGTGRTATGEQAGQMCEFIRNTLIDLYGEDTADQVIIQYGGSVKPANAAEIMNMAEIDGALVGGASLKAKDFMEIIDF